MLREYLLQCFNSVNRMIYNKASESKENKGMATTAVILYIWDDKAYVVNIGDSRAYLARDGQLSQVTEDHTYVNELIKRGSISSDEAKTHPKRNMITRALGSEVNFEPDLFKFDIYKGDIILLCTDGLYNEIEIDEINSLINRYKEAAVVTDNLVARANEQGGNDNITVICVEI